MEIIRVNVCNFPDFSPDAAEPRPEFSCRKQEVIKTSWSSYISTTSTPPAAKTSTNTSWTTWTWTGSLSIETDFSFLKLNIKEVDL